MVDHVRGVTALPWPPAWRRPSWGGWRVSVLCGVLLVPVSAATAVAIGQGQPGRAVLVGLGALVLGAVGVAARPRRRAWVVEQSAVDVDGTVEPGVRFAVRPSSVLTGMALAAGGVALLAAAVAMVVIVASRGEARFLVGAVVVGVPGALLLVGGIAALTASREGNAVDLTANRVLVDTGHGRTAVPWTEVDDVTAALAAVPVGRSAAIQNLIVIAVAPSVDRAERLVIACDRLVADPALVYHGLRHYLLNPDDRGELSSAAAVRRLEAGRVVSADDPPDH